MIIGINEVLVSFLQISKRIHSLWQLLWLAFFPTEKCKVSYNIKNYILFICFCRKGDSLMFSSSLCMREIHYYSLLHKRYASSNFICVQNYNAVSLLQPLSFVIHFEAWVLYIIRLMIDDRFLVNCMMQ